MGTGKQTGKTGKATKTNAKAKIFRIAIDEENNADLWWDHADREAATCPFQAGAACELIEPPTTHEVVVTAEEHDAFVGWASEMPGWEDGPAYARKPFVIQELDYTRQDVRRGHSDLYDVAGSPTSACGLPRRWASSSACFATTWTTAIPAARIVARPGVRRGEHRDCPPRWGVPLVIA